MLDLDRLDFRYEPYPIACASGIFSDADYEALSTGYPEIGLFLHKPENGDKYSLSELNNPEAYRRFLGASPVWTRFHDHMKSNEFIEGILAHLKTRNVDLGLRRVAIASRSGRRRSSIPARLGRRTELSARFEFSIIGGNGGNLRPHTDHPDKLVTLVLSMSRPGEWNHDWGGGTTVCLPKDRTRVFNHANAYMQFGEVDDIHDYAFNPNQCVLFVKTYNSWHHVAPIHAPEGAAARKTLTINIERLP